MRRTGEDTERMIGAARHDFETTRVWAAIVARSLTLDAVTNRSDPNHCGGSGQPHPTPGFLIVGAPKSGTTALHNYLQGHPQIFMSRRKEPRYFCSEYYEQLSSDDPRAGASSGSVVRDWNDYIALFAEASGEDYVAVGEASVQYLYLHRLAVPRILAELGRDTKIVIILRNPIDRAFSAYSRAIRDGFQHGSLTENLEKEADRKRDNWSLGHLHSSLGFYSEAVSSYLSTFPDTAVRLYDDMLADPGRFVRDIASFVGATDDFEPDLSVRYNVAGTPRSRAIHRVLSGRSALTRLAAPMIKAMAPEARLVKVRERLVQANLDRSRNQVMTGAERETLLEIFREDILSLQDVIGRDLSSWLRIDKIV